MSTSARRAREREGRRQAILAAARALFTEQGIDPTSVDSIAARAELAKGTFYLYFKSKEEVLVALLEHDLERLRDVAAEMLAQLPSVLVALDLLLDAVLAFYRNRPVGIHAFLRAPGREMDELLRERLCKQRDSILEILTELIRKGQTYGELRPNYDPPAAAKMLWSSFIGTVMLHESGGVSDLESQLRTVAAIAREGLVADKRA